jgi:hypothetical protein
MHNLPQFGLWPKNSSLAHEVRKGLIAYHKANGIIVMKKM